MTTPNFQLLHEQLDWIREDIALREQGLAPSGVSWNQGDWFTGEIDDETGRVNMCGSKACLAGHTLLAVGAKPNIVEERVNVFNDHTDDGWTVATVRKVDQSCMVLSGQVVTIESTAAEILGLDEDQAAALFSASNTFHDLEMLVKDWENEV